MLRFGRSVKKLKAQDLTQLNFTELSPAKGARPRKCEVGGDMIMSSKQVTLKCLNQISLQ